SLIAPDAAVSQKDVLIYKTWNEEYQKIYKNESAERFDDQVPSSARLNLSRLWVLTSQNTASASEVIISGLQPHMNVYTIGDATTGKNTGGSVFSPDDDTEDKGAYLITMSYENKNRASVAGGIPPYRGYSTNAVYQDASDLGNPSEPLLKIALEEISGTRSTRTLEADDTTLQYTQPATPPRLIATPRQH
ncbi:MAG: hypothetical protein LBI96_08035, partial [Odoribacteraceae bacterium]|nr:hypothetical protein [Odoribacteraceae bacterium]